MENAVEALKIAFAVMMFVLALTVSISSFSNANSAVKSLISMNDRENEYIYVEPSPNLTRIVGVETVVSSMYRAMEQNIEIYFKKEGNDEFLPLFWKTTVDNAYNFTGSNKYKVKSADPNIMYEQIFSIDSLNENVEYKKMHIDIILGGRTIIDETVDKYVGLSDPLNENYKEMYYNKIEHYQDGLYDYFTKHTSGKFREEFGEYLQSEGANESKKRVITYTIMN